MFFVILIINTATKFYFRWKYKDVLPLVVVVVEMNVVGVTATSSWECRRHY